ncbi:MAG: leucine-rich repeat domain-containing protein [Clostridia bacterium]|nr:leucine-rich repeat domain-containing protein [Clostridia bacterium]
MKKKLICLLLLAAMAASLCSCAVIDNLAVLQKSTDGMTYKEVDGEIHITGYSDKTTVTELTIPDEIDGKPVTVIADFGVSNADSLKVITLGKNVREIGTWGLTNNQHLAAFAVAEGNTAFKAEDGVLFSADGKTLYNYPCGRGIEFDRFGMAPTDEEGNSVYVDYEIPDGVETVRDKAFYKCYYVNVTRFPDTISVIGEKAFHKCTSLKDFTMPAAIERIGKDAFSYNENLTHLEIGENIKEIGEYAFFYCKNLKSLTIRAKESDLTLGKKWQPTDKGKILEDLTVTFAE